MSLYEKTWGRAFAAMYDKMLAATEEAGLEDRRRRLIGEASGRVLEIGAGTGLNLAHYGAVEELILAEPEPAMAKRLRERVASHTRERDAGPTSIEVVTAPGEALPAEDGSIDTVVSTLVLCTVSDLNSTISEIARVLRPGGRLLFIEHVRSADPKRARWQDRLHRPWKAIGYGCNCNRDTLAALQASSLEVSEVDHGKLPKAVPIVEPLIQGSATRPA